MLVLAASGCSGCKMAAPIPDAMSLSQAERNREAQGPKPFLQALIVYPKRDALPGALLTSIRAGSHGHP